MSYMNGNAEMHYNLGTKQHKFNKRAKISEIQKRKDFTLEEH